MKSYKIQCNCDLILSYSNDYNNICINQDLLDELCKVKGYIDYSSSNFGYGLSVL